MVTNYLYLKIYMVRFMRLTWKGNDRMEEVKKNDLVTWNTQISLIDIENTKAGLYIRCPECVSVRVRVTHPWLTGHVVGATIPPVSFSIGVQTVELSGLVSTSLSQYITLLLADWVQRLHPVLEWNSGQMDLSLICHSKKLHTFLLLSHYFVKCEKVM